MQAHTDRTPSADAPGAGGTRNWRTRHGAEVPAISVADAPAVTLQPYYHAGEVPGAPIGCQCQFYGKSGVPYPSRKCMVCGYRVSLEGAVA